MKGQRMRALALMCAAVGVACGSDGRDGEPCTVVDNGSSATITCPDGSSAIITDGTNGQNGTNGTNGSDAKMTSSLLCGGQIPSSSLWYVYRAATLSGGATFVFAGIKDGVIEAGASAFYSGPSVPYVNVTDDELGANTGGWWEFQAVISTKTLTITYNDSDLGGTGKTTYVQPTSECTLYNY